MGIEDRSLGGDFDPQRQSGYLPLHPPVYRRLWRLRQGAVPCLCTCFMRTSPHGQPKLKKSGRKLKTPRMMLPTLLG